MDSRLILADFQPKNSQKTAKKIICQNPNLFMKFSEIWNVDASQQKKCFKKLFLDFGLFWPFFTQKTATKKLKKNCQNPNRLMNFFEIWYVDVSQQRKCYKKTFFVFRRFLAVF